MGGTGQGTGEAPYWVGASDLCVDPSGRVLLVLQGHAGEPRTWGLPGGGCQPGESVEACCLRELWEETGYRGTILRPLGAKTGRAGGHPFAVHRFEVRVTGGEPRPRDPDGLIHQVGWFGAEEARGLRWSFPEDGAWVLDRLGRRAGPPTAPAPGKLVRDRIPEHMGRLGEAGRFRVAEPDEMVALLVSKAREEAAEVAASGGSAEEIADLLEVLEALVRHNGSARAVEQARAAKRSTHGAFERWFVLEGRGGTPQGPADAARDAPESRHG